MASTPANSAHDPLIARIVGQAGVIRKKFPTARAIGITVGPVAAGAADVEARDGRYVVRPCSTPLAARLALRDATGSDSTLVLVTPLADDAVGSDVVVRLADQKLFPLDSWGVVRERFQTPRIDHRIHGRPCLADWLAETSAGVDVPKPAGGFLDADTAWSFLLNAALGMTDRTYDPVELLLWTIDAAAVRRWHDLAADRRAATAEWFGIRGGNAARSILESLDRRSAVGPLALGLAIDVLQRAGAEERVNHTLLTRSQVRIDERYFGGHPPDAPVLAAWGQAAVRAVELHLGGHRDRERRDAIRQADDVIRDIDAVPLAAVSRVSLLGFEGRLAEFATALDAAAERPTTPARRELLDAFHRLEDHHEAVHAAASFQRAEMAVRLVRWLAEREVAPPTATSFAMAAADHFRDGGFAVWAREVLRSGEPLPDFERAIAKLVTRVDAAVDADATRFATQLAGWIKDGGRDEGVLPVEKILEKVVAPVAAHVPVLLVVIDGLSAAVYHELAAQILRSWTAIAPDGNETLLPGIATVPSETKYSRTSLLAGRLVEGGQAEEVAGFECHPALLAAARKSPPPRLFHEADLAATGGTGLSAEVRQEIGDAARRVVGVVLNSIDDSLAKGKQTRIAWQLDMLRHLPSLLKEARDAGRAVIVTGDHGHVLELASSFRNGGEAARWRGDTDRPDDGEVRLAGGRVLAANGKLVAAWREQIRYTTSTSRGYHGGASPQEMVVPIGVFVPWTDSGSLPTGWDLARVDVPAWWDEPRRRQADEPTPPVVVTAGPRKNMLFDLETGEVAKPVRDRAAAAKPEWISRLLASEVYKAQRKLLGRGAPAEEQVETALAALADRGGVMTSAAFARAMKLAPFRLVGLVTALGRLLNIDGFRVVGRNIDADEVTLDVDLLHRQFDLAGEENAP